MLFSTTDTKRCHPGRSQGNLIGLDRVGAPSFRLFSADVRGLASAAVRSGGQRVSMSRMEWDISGHCEAPVERAVYGRPDERLKRGDALEVIMLVACRKCQQCRRAKARHWADRAAAEVHKSKRTRLVTLTVRPEIQEAMWLRRVNYLAVRGIDADMLSPKEQFAERAAVFSPELTKWLKRVRKRADDRAIAVAAKKGLPKPQRVRLRYLLVAEAHKKKQCGLPHFHLLLHELSGEVTLSDLGFRKDDNPSWRLGFGQSKVCWPNKAGDVGAVTYVCKYLAKDLNARVRASLRYGRVSGPKITPERPSLECVAERSEATDIHNMKIISIDVNSTQENTTANTNPSVEGLKQ